MAERRSSEVTEIIKTSIKSIYHFLLSSLLLLSTAFLSIFSSTICPPGLPACPEMQLRRRSAQCLSDTVTQRHSDSAPPRLRLNAIKSKRKQRKQSVGTLPAASTFPPLASSLRLTVLPAIAYQLLPFATSLPPSVFEENSLAQFRSICSMSSSPPS